jgi:hypothetical protein
MPQRAGLATLKQIGVAEFLIFTFAARERLKCDCRASRSGRPPGAIAAASPARSVSEKATASGASIDGSEQRRCEWGTFDISCDLVFETTQR